MTLSSFYEECEEIWWESELIHEVLSNVENIIEHAPGYILSDKINLEVYKQSQAMRILMDDIELLQEWVSGENEDFLLKKRKLRLMRK